MSPAIDVIIVNWNAGEQLWTCLHSLAYAAWQGAPVSSVIVVDNASSDRSLDGIEALRLPLTVIRNATNLGFGKACNQGARIGKADYLLFLNPDMRVNANSLQIPLAFLENEANARYAVAGVRLRNLAGEISRSCARFPTPWRFFASAIGLDRLLPSHPVGIHMSDWAHDAPSDVDHVIGAFYLIRRNIFEQIGGFDERFFVYLEDLDLSYRVHQAGYRIRYMIEAEAIHKGGGTSEAVQAQRLFFALRSRIQYAFKHFSRKAAVAVLFTTFILEPPVRLGFAAMRRSSIDWRNTLSAYRLLGRDALATCLSGPNDTNQSVMSNDG